MRSTCRRQEAGLSTATAQQAQHGAAQRSAGRGLAPCQHSTGAALQQLLSRLRVSRVPQQSSGVCTCGSGFHEGLRIAPHARVLLSACRVRCPVYSWYVGSHNCRPVLLAGNRRLLLWGISCSSQVQKQGLASCAPPLCEVRFSSAAALPAVPFLWALACGMAFVCGWRQKPAWSKRLSGLGLEGRVELSLKKLSCAFGWLMCVWSGSQVISSRCH